MFFWFTILAIISAGTNAFARGTPCPVLFSAIHDAFAWRRHAGQAQRNPGEDIVIRATVDRQVEFSSEQAREAWLRGRLSAWLQGLSFGEAGSESRLVLVPRPEAREILIRHEGFGPSEMAAIRERIENDPEFLAIFLGQAKTKLNPNLSAVYPRDAARLGFVRGEEEPLLGPDRQIFTAVEDFGPSRASERQVAIAWDADAGIEAFGRAQAAGLVSDRLISRYQPQHYRTFCGAASVCMAIDSLSGPHGQLDFVAAAEGLKPWLTTVYERGDNPGFQLGELALALRMRGFPNTMQHAYEGGLENFRRQVRDSLAHPDQELIVNFNGRALGSQTGGHFSPIGAYDPSTDSVLVLDVAAHKNEPFWVPVRDLFVAMMENDSGSMLPRGYLVVSK